MTPPLVEENVIVAVPVPVTVQDTVLDVSQVGESMSVNGLSRGFSGSAPAKKPMVLVALSPEASLRPSSVILAVDCLTILTSHACFNASGRNPLLVISSSNRLRWP